MKFQFLKSVRNLRRVLCVLVFLGGSEGIESERLQNRSRPAMTWTEVSQREKAAVLETV